MIIYQTGLWPQRGYRCGKFLYYLRKAIMTLGPLVCIPSLVPKVNQANQIESRDKVSAVVVLRGVVYHSEICIQCRSWANLVGSGNLRVNRSAGRVSEAMDCASAEGEESSMRIAINVLICARGEGCGLEMGRAEKAVRLRVITR